MNNDTPNTKDTLPGQPDQPSNPDKEYPHAMDFIDRFIAYVTDRERDFIKRFKTMVLIEIMLKQDPESVAMLFFRREAERVFADVGKDAAVEWVGVWLRTKIAGEKLGYHELGLLKTKEKGDLRGARLVTDEREQFFAVMKLKVARENPRMQAFAMRETAKLDPKFHLRLGRLLNKSPLEFDDLNRSKLQSYILAGWATEGKDRKGQPIPPLCYCSDPVIAKLAEFLGIQQNVTAGLVKKTWERLGLRKSSKLVFWDVRKQLARGTDRRFQKIVLSDLRHRN